MPATYADIIFFAVVAVYLGIKLFSVLGKKNEEDTKFESKRASSFGMPDIGAAKAAKDAPIPQAVRVETAPQNNLDDFNFADSNAKSGVKEIISKDPAFSINSFVEGAKIAFEMLIKAYSENDRKTLKNLLAEEAYMNMEQHMNELAEREVTAHKTLVAIDNIEIISASSDVNTAKIGIRFHSEQISVVRDKAGNIIEGDPKMIENVEDVWEFERNIRSANPNWTITSL